MFQYQVLLLVPSGSQGERQGAAQLAPTPLQVAEDHSSYHLLEQDAPQRVFTTTAKG